jgi:hypothetical protein
LLLRVLLVRADRWNFLQVQWLCRRLLARGVPQVLGTLRLVLVAAWHVAAHLGGRLGQAKLLLVENRDLVAVIRQDF